jgi:hypothetical protein
VQNRNKKKRETQNGDGNIVSFSFDSPIPISSNSLPLLVRRHCGGVRVGLLSTQCAQTSRMSEWLHGWTFPPAAAFLCFPFCSPFFLFLFLSSSVRPGRCREREKKQSWKVRVEGKKKKETADGRKRARVLYAPRLMDTQRTRNGNGVLENRNEAFQQRQSAAAQLLLQRQRVTGVEFEERRCHLFPFSIFFSLLFSPSPSQACVLEIWSERRNKLVHQTDFVYRFVSVHPVEICFSE